MLPEDIKQEPKAKVVHTVDGLYTNYIDDLYAYALGFGFDKQTAMDAIHDVFCKICLREKDLQNIQEPKFYLLRALRNQLIDTYKLKRNAFEIPTEQISDELPYRLKVTVEDEMIAVEEQLQISQRVEEILSVLTERQREVIYLRYMQECSYEEIAEIMQISVPACRKLLYRTLTKLKRNNTLVLLYLLLSINVG